MGDGVARRAVRWLRTTEPVDDDELVLEPCPMDAVAIGLIVDLCAERGVTVIPREGNIAALNHTRYPVGLQVRRGDLADLHLVMRMVEDGHRPVRDDEDRPRARRRARRTVELELDPLPSEREEE